MLRKLSTAFLMLLATQIKAQNCKLIFAGSIRDQHTQQPLPGAKILLVETGQIAFSDSNGYFQLQAVCSGASHITISHLNCEPSKLFFNFVHDTTVQLQLEHFDEHHHEKEAVVKSTRSKIYSQTNFLISGDELRRDAGKSIAEIATQSPGVGLIKNGSGINKPVIHGLFGNRISVVNNGIAIAGQKWGNDHAPEIDPFSASQISVIKGVDAIMYGDNSLGAVIVVEPAAIKKDPHVHGALQYVFNSNGRGNTLAANVEQSRQHFDWRINASFKLIGDHSSPHYFLSNTGSRENNVSLLLSQQHSLKWTSKFYYSLFQTKLGILKGAMLESVNDLLSAYNRQEPFYTDSNLSYHISEPRQFVTHHFANLQSKYQLNANANLQLNIGTQLNLRKEYDVRRNGRSDIPVLDMLLASQFVETKYVLKINNNEYKSGLQYKFNYNENSSETGIKPLVPNYVLHHLAAFQTVQVKKNKWVYEAGMRFDRLLWSVMAISLSNPNLSEALRYKFSNYSASLGARYNLAEHFTLKLNTGVCRRSPEMNELFSQGLHQGVAAIEEGNRNLRPETGFKSIASLNFDIKEKLFVECSPYYNYLADYIFLEPQKDYRLTIRGAYPVFIYKQTDARIYGFDAFAKYQVGECFEWTNKVSLLRGDDLRNNAYLVYMPGDQYSSQGVYTISKLKKIKELRLGLGLRHQAKQWRLKPEQDLVAAPAAYTLFNALIEANFLFKKSDLHLTVQADNLLNTAYRDYLNRLRYFALDEGRNVRLGLKWDF